MVEKNEKSSSFELGILSFIGLLSYLASFLWVFVYSELLTITSIQLSSFITLSILALVIIFKLIFQANVENDAIIDRGSNAFYNAAIFILIIYSIIPLVKFFTTLPNLQIISDSIINVYVKFNIIFCIGSMVYIFSKYMILYPIVERFKVSWCKAILILLASFLFVRVIGWLQVEDIAFFIAIIVSLSFSSKVFENVHDYLKEKEKDPWLERIATKLMNPEELNPSEWDGKIQLQKIELSIGLISLYILFRYTEQVPLFFEYIHLHFDLNNSAEFNFDNFGFWDSFQFYFFKSLDRVYGIIILFYVLVTFRSIENYHYNIYKVPKSNRIKKIYWWIFFILFFILPIFRNISANIHFELGVKTILEEQESLEKGEYELEFINKYNHQINNKQIVFKSKDKSYTYYYEDKHLIKIWENNSRLLASKEVTSDD